MYNLSTNTKQLIGELTLSGSKSESNRVLVIRHLSEDTFNIDNLSSSEDTRTIQHCLEQINTQQIFDIGHAGTCMRFLTAVFAITPGERILKGSDRMHQRPIKELVNALRLIGADIEYIEEQGYPPLKIKGGALSGGKVEIDGAISSQYVTALMLIAPCLENGLEINIKGTLVSEPYAKMTEAIMSHFGAHTAFSSGQIKVEGRNYVAKDYYVESDWSSASYWYEAAGFCDAVDLKIYGLKYERSLQSDAVVKSIYANFGITTEAIKGGVWLKKTRPVIPQNLRVNCIDFPDIAQTLACTSIVCKSSSLLSGLITLRIKETDRMVALQNELSKLNCIVMLEEDELTVNPMLEVSESLLVSTYKDHRMAMSFAMLVFCLGEISIENPEVVEKSYPEFWQDLARFGVAISK